MTIRISSEKNPSVVTGANRHSALLILQVMLCLLTGCSAPKATRTWTAGAGGAERTAVYSRASKDYVRAQNPDGSFKPESYVLKDGGNFGGPRVDVTIDRMSFDDVSRVITPPLATLNYVPSEDPAASNLLIVVFWGTTVVGDDVIPHDTRESKGMANLAAAAESEEGDREQAAERNAESGGKGHPGIDTTQHWRLLGQQAADFFGAEGDIDASFDSRNANILGYTEEILRTSPRGPDMGELKDEIEHDRYFVVLLAYDYQLARKFGLHKLLWETRFSIPETGNDFAKEFPRMAAIASQFFGQDSHGLIHHNLADTHVEIGEPKTLGTVPEK
jgi:hypothetical protein